MDLSAIMQNLCLTRSRSPSPDREVTLQMLPHHREPPYQQIETYPGEDILKRNFRDLLEDSQQMSEAPNRHVPSSRRPLHPQAEREQPMQQQQRSFDPAAHVEPAMHWTSTGNYSEEECREQVVREQGLREQELDRLSRIQDDAQQMPLSTGSESVFMPIPILRSDHLAKVKHEIIAQLRFFGVKSQVATAIAGRLEGQNRDTDYATVVEFIPNLGPLQCSVPYFERCIRNILNGGSASRVSEDQRPELGPEHFDYVAYYSSPPPPMASAVPSSVSTPRTTATGSISTSTPTPSPSRPETLPPLFGMQPQQSPSQPQAPNPTASHPTRSLASFFSPPALQANSIPQPPQPTRAASPAWGSPEWELRRNQNRNSDVADLALPVAPRIPVRAPITYPALNTSSPVAVLPPATSSAPGRTGPATGASPAPSPAAPVGPSPAPAPAAPGLGPSPAPVPATGLTAAPDYTSISMSSPEHAPPITPARTSVPQHLKEEILTTRGMSRSPSASPSTSVFRSGPQKESITIRGNSAIEAHYFAAVSPGPVTEPPSLKANHLPELGDLLFNKFPTPSANLKKAQVWMWTDPEGTANPDWEDIVEFYGSLANPIKHPRDSTRFLTKAKKDGKPAWVTENTLKQHIAQAAKEGDN